MNDCKSLRRNISTLISTLNPYVIQNCISNNGEIAVIVRTNKRMGGKPADMLTIAIRNAIKESQC